MILENPHQRRKLRQIIKENRRLQARVHQLKDELETLRRSRVAELVTDPAEVNNDAAKSAGVRRPAGKRSRKQG